MFWAILAEPLESLFLNDKDWLGTKNRGLSHEEKHLFLLLIVSVLCSCRASFRPEGSNLSSSISEPSPISDDLSSGLPDRNNSLMISL